MLLIHCVADVRWVAAVSNTPISYTFKGITRDEQEESVRAFAQTLANGEDDVYQFFRSPDLPPGELEEQLFGDTNEIMFGGEFDLAFDDELIYNTVKVGEFILELIL